MHIPHKQYRKVEHSNRKNILVLSVAGVVFLLTILFSSHAFNFSGGMQASVLSSATQSITKTVSDKVTSNPTLNQATNVVNIAQDALGSDPTALLSGAKNAVISNATSAINSVTNSAVNSVTNSLTNSVSGITSVVSPTALSNLSNLNIGTLGSALNISSFSKLSSVSNFVSGSSIASKVSHAFGLGGGDSAGSLISKIEAMGYEERRNFFGNTFTTVDEVASIIQELSATKARDTILDMMDTGNASQVVNAISIGKAKDILAKMTKDNGARIMNGMDPARVVSLLGQFSPSEALQRLSLMDETKRAEALRIMSSSQLAAIANVMTPENAADVLSKIDATKAGQVYALMDITKRTDAINRLDSETRASIFSKLRELSKSSEKGLWDYVSEAFTIPSAYAADDTKTEEATAYQNIIKKFNDILAFIFFIIHQILFWPLLSLIGSLVDNDFVMGGQISETLRSVWVQVRDLVNIAFVFVLLLIALFSVIGSEELESKLPMKSTLPKIIVAMILVNFTFFISKMAIDTVNILTTAVYAIPTQTEAQKTDLSDIKVVSYNDLSCNLDRMWGCEEWRAKCYVSQGGTQLPADQKQIEYFKSHPEEMDEGLLMSFGCISRVKGINGPYEQCIADQKESNYHFFVRENIGSSYVTNYFSQDGDKVVYTDLNLYNLERDHIICHFPMAKSEYISGQGENNQTTSDGRIIAGGNLVSRGVIFTIAKNFETLIRPEKFYDSNGIQTPGTFFAFLADNIFIIFMFVALFFAFLALAIALLIRVAVLWVIIALSPLVVVQKVVFGNFGGMDLLDTFIQHLLIPLKVAVFFTLAFIFMNSIDGMFHAGAWATLTNIFAFIKGEDVNTGLIAANGDSVSVLQYIIYLIITVAILWVGVFKSFESAEYVKGITGKIQGLGNMALSAPKYIPLPVPGIKGGASVAALGGVASGVRSTLVDMQVGKTSDVVEKITNKYHNSAKQAAHESKDAEGFALRVVASTKTAKDLNDLDNKEFKETLHAAHFKTDKIDDKTISRLKIGDENTWRELKTEKGEQFDYQAMARAMREAKQTATADAGPSETENKNALLDASTTAGVTLTIHNLEDGIEEINKKIKEDNTLTEDQKNNLEQKKISTINQTALQTEKEHGGLTPEDAKIIADSLSKINIKDRDDALQELDVQDIIKVAKALHVEAKATVRDENSNLSVERIYSVNKEGKVVDNNQKEIARPSESDTPELKKQKEANLKIIKDSVISAIIGKK